MFNQGNRFLGFLGSNGGHSQTHDIEGYCTTASSTYKFNLNNTIVEVPTDSSKYWYYDIPTGVEVRTLKFRVNNDSNYLTSISFKNTIVEKKDHNYGVTLSTMFQSCAYLEEIQGLEYLGTAAINISTTVGMFEGCNRLERGLEGLINWYTGFLTSTKNMFKDCYKLSSTNYFSSWSTSKLHTISGMFQNTNINDLSGLKNWFLGYSNASANIDASYAFSGTKIKSVEPLKTWKTGSNNGSNKCFTNFEGMFKNCYYLESLRGLENWEVGRQLSNTTTNLNNMFENCYQLIRVKELQSWQIYQGIADITTTVTNMFKGCSALKVLMLHSATGFEEDSNGYYILPISNVGINTHCDVYLKSSIINSGKINTTNPSYESFVIDTVYLHPVNQIEGISSGSVIVTYDDDTTATVSPVSNIVSLNEDKLIKGLDFSNANFYGDTKVGSLGTLPMTSTRNMFKDKDNIRIYGLENWITPNLTDIRAMFENCDGLYCADVSGFDVRNVLYATTMFKNVNKIFGPSLSLDLSKWETNKNCNFYEMFSGAKNIRVDLGKNPFFHSDQFGMGSLFDDSTNVICYSGNEECVTKMANAGYTSYIIDVSDETKYRRISGKIDYNYFINIYGAYDGFAYTDIEGKFWLYDYKELGPGNLSDYEDNYYDFIEQIIGSVERLPQILQYLTIESPSNATVTTNALDLTDFCSDAQYNYDSNGDRRMNYIKLDLNFGGLDNKNKVAGMFSKLYDSGPVVVLGRTVDFVNGPFPSTTSSFSELGMFIYSSSMTTLTSIPVVIIDKDYIPFVMKTAYNFVKFVS